MNTHKLLDYQLYLQREAHFTHQDASVETPFYQAVARGDVEQILENQRKYGKYRTEGKGSLSESPLRNQIYHLVVNATLLSRFCMRDGLSSEIALTLTDIYIRRADTCRTPVEVMDLNDEMSLDFARRMQELHSQGCLSSAVRRTVDYICDHLHEHLTTALLADHVHLNRSYLSCLFKKETGRTIHDYILKKRMEIAANMLMLTDAPCADIAFTLNFSSQSYFTQCFREFYGCTPGQYRLQNR